MSMQSEFEVTFTRQNWEKEINLLIDRLIELSYLVKPETTENHVKLNVNPYPKPNDLDLIKSLIEKQHKRGHK